MYSNYYSPQVTSERIDNQIAQLQQMKAQLPQAPQPTNLTQNFQIAPTSQNMMRYASSIDDVNKEFVIGDTPFFSKDMSVLWIKNAKGDIKAYSITEIIQKDEKDLMIESLQMQINELKKGMSKDAKSTNDDANEPTKNKKPSNVSDGGAGTEKQHESNGVV